MNQQESEVVRIILEELGFVCSARHNPNRVEHLILDCYYEQEGRAKIYINVRGVHDVAGAIRAWSKLQ